MVGSGSANTNAIRALPKSCGATGSRLEPPSLRLSAIAPVTLNAVQQVARSERPLESGVEAVVDAPCSCFDTG